MYRNTGSNMKGDYMSSTKLKQFREAVRKVLEVSGKKVMAKKVDWPRNGGFCQFVGPRREEFLRGRGYFEITLEEAFRHGMITPIRIWDQSFSGFRVGKKTMIYEYRFKRYGVPNVE